MQARMDCAGIETPRAEFFGRTFCSRKPEKHFDFKLFAFDELRQFCRWHCHGANCAIEVTRLLFMDLRYLRSGKIYPMFLVGVNDR